MAQGMQMHILSTLYFIGGIKMKIEQSKAYSNELLKLIKEGSSVYSDEALELLKQQAALYSLKLTEDEILKSTCCHRIIGRDRNHISMLKYCVTKKGPNLYRCMRCGSEFNLDEPGSGFSNMDALTASLINEARQKYYDLIKSNALKYSDLELMDKLEFYLAAFDSYSEKEFSKDKERSAYKIALAIIGDRIKVSNGTASSLSHITVSDIDCRFSLINIDNADLGYCMTLANILVCGY